MRNRVAVVGAAALLLALAGCTADGDVAADPAPDAAQPSYVAPDGAPAFCERLASSAELTELPMSIGLLVAGPDIEARTQVSETVQELRAVLADARDGSAPAGVVAALEDLVGALVQVADGGATDAVRAAVSDGLRQVGAQAQPVCGFPT